MIELTRRAAMVAAGGAAVSMAVGGAVVLRTVPAREQPVRPGGGTLTSYGWVVLVRTSRFDIGEVQGSVGGAHGHGAAGPGRPVPSRVHGAWSGAARFDVAVHNASRQAVGLSPGQFRVRVDDAGPTISLYEADRDADPLGAGATATLRITYLVPPAPHRLTLEFTDLDDTVAVVPLAPEHAGHDGATP